MARRWVDAEPACSHLLLLLLRRLHMHWLLRLLLLRWGLPGVSRGRGGRAARAAGSRGRS
jgi:hypothetical protein